jgi:hypothetical protein
VFLISLERSWSVDVRNGLAWVIWTFAAQVMDKRRAGSQIGSLTPDHKKSGIDPTPMCNEGVRHGVGKLLRRATTLVQNSSQQRSGWEVMMAQSLGSPNQDNFGTPLWESRDKEPLGCGQGGTTQRIIYGGRWWLLPSPGCGESNESKVAHGLSQHQKDAEWVLTNLWLILDAGPCNKIIVPLPSLIPGLLARPSYPL